MLFDDFVIDIENVSKVFNIFEKLFDWLLQMLLFRLGWIVFGVGEWLLWQCGCEFWVLCDVSLRVKWGDVVGIIGCNGFGKLILLQIIVGIFVLMIGWVQVNGCIVVFLEFGSGFNLDFIGCENVLLNGMILGLIECEVLQCFDVIVVFVDIGDFIDQFVWIYFSGMMLCLVFVVQMQVELDIFIVDEVLVVGDVLFQKCCFQQMEVL